MIGNFRTEICDIHAEFHGDLICVPKFVVSGLQDSQKMTYATVPVYLRQLFSVIIQLTHHTAFSGDIHCTVASANIQFSPRPFSKSYISRIQLPCQLSSLPVVIFDHR